MKYIFRSLLVLVFLFSVGKADALTFDEGSMPVSGRTQWPYVQTPSFSSGVQFQTVKNIRTDADTLRLLYINNTANSITFQASVRKGFNGTPEMVLFSGSATATIAARTTLTSDELSFSVEEGDFVYDRTFFSSPTSQQFSSGYINTAYNPENISVTGSISGENLMEGYVMASSSRLLETGITFEHDIPFAVLNQNSFGAYAVLGIPEDENIRFTTFTGDSKTADISEDRPGSYGGKSWASIGMGLGVGNPYQNLSIPGEALSIFMNSNPQNVLRRELLEFGGDFVDKYGYNSIIGGMQTAETELSLKQGYFDLLPEDSRLFLSTLDPATTLESGSWSTASTSDQEKAANWEELEEYNDEIRSDPGQVGASGFIDTGLPVSVSLDEWYWKPNLTGDGIHQNENGNIAQGNYFAARWPVEYDVTDPEISSDEIVIDETSVLVTWVTDEAASSSVSYGFTDSYGSASTSSAYVTSHQIILSGLAACTEYHYQISSADASGNQVFSDDLIFTTIGCVVEEPEEEEGESPWRNGGRRRIVSSAPVVLPSAPLPASPLLFSRVLTVGDVGPDVLLLQQYLNANGFFLALTGPGSPGNETSMFGGLTRSALARFQASKRISPAVGYFGPITKAYIETN